MKHYIKLLRIKDWVKNFFLFLPSFFAGVLFQIENLELLIGGFFAFSFIASSIYILNDYMDIEDDRKHPTKSKRPLAAGTVSKPAAIGIFIILILAGISIGYFLDSSFKFLFILGLYFCINLGYCLGLKNISILDVMILSSGFVLRVKAGAVLSDVPTSHWFSIMIFLLSLFMALAKRRDDVLLKISTGNDMRKSIKGYNLDFLNTMLGLFSAIMIVAYIMYTVDGAIIERLQTHRLYYTSVFVIAGLMRYLQITLVNQESGSPTKILYRDRFIQIVLVLWVASFYFILYMRDVTIFRK